jgi:hypothetical protein
MCSSVANFARRAVTALRCSDSAGLRPRMDDIGKYCESWRPAADEDE